MIFRSQNTRFGFEQLGHDHYDLAHQGFGQLKLGLLWSGQRRQDWKGSSHLRENLLRLK